MIEYCSLQEAAELLHVHEMTVRRLVHYQLIPAWRMGPRLIRIAYPNIVALRNAMKIAKRQQENVNAQRIRVVARTVHYPSHP